MSTAAPYPAASNERDINLMRAMFFTFYIGTVPMLVFLVQYYRDILHLTGTQIGAIVALPPVISMIANPLWGLLNDRFGRIRTLFLITGLGGILAVLGLSFTTTFWPVALFTVVYAFFNQPINSLLNGVTIKVLGPNPERYGSVRVWGAISFVIFNQVFGIVLEQIGLHWLFYFYIIGMVIMLVIVALLSPQKATLTRPVLEGVGELVRNRAWLLLMLGVLLIGVGNIAMNSFIVVYMSDLGGSTSLVGTMWAITAGTEIPVFFLGAKVLRRFGSSKLLAIAAVAFAIRFVFYSLMTRPEWALVIGLLQSITFAPWLLAGVAVADEFAPADLKATGQGIYTAALSAAAVFSNLISGSIYDRWGGPVLFRVLAGFSALALIAVVAGAFEARRHRAALQTAALE